MRKIDDIVPPSRRRDPVTSDSSGSDTPAGSKRPRARFPYRTLIAAIVVILISIGALYYFSSAKVEVTPNTLSAAVQGSYTATQNSGSLPYEIITSQKVASQAVQGNGTKDVSTSASGDIIVYNTLSHSQRLINNTRFATASGLIFRIHSAITVPAGSASNPGTLKVRAYADKPGASYNVGPTSFTVPGLAGTSIQSAIYARSTAPMTGGASGMVPVVDAATSAKATSALIAALGPQLTKSLAAEVPKGYTLLPGAATTTYTTLTPSASSTAGMVDVKEQGTATAVIFPTADLAKAIATGISGLNYAGQPLSILPSSTLKLVAASLPTASDTSFSFTLSGTANLVYTIDTTTIAGAVAGKTRTEAESVLTNYPAVKSAILVLRPFWTNSFPQDPTAIKVTVSAPQ